MYYSQFGEDHLLAEFFRNKPSGLCVEVGANDGINGSTTLYFESLGWNCILVEPNPALCEAISKFRTAQLFSCAASNNIGVVVLHVVGGAEHADGMSTISADEQSHRSFMAHGFTSTPITVKTNLLDNILTEAGVDSPIDFISIDVEGHELQVLQGLSLNRWKPRLLLIEDNSAFDDAVITKYMRTYGYRRFKRTGVNDWYAHISDKEAHTLRNRTNFILRKLEIRARKKLRGIRLLHSAYRRLRS
jgi:FkbM family methyltransferase